MASSTTGSSTFFYHVPSIIPLASDTDQGDVVEGVDSERVEAEVVSIGARPSPFEHSSYKARFLTGTGYAMAGDDMVAPSNYGVAANSTASTAVKKPGSTNAEQKTKFKAMFRKIVESEIFEFGVRSAAEAFVEDQLLRRPNFTKNCLNELYLEYAATDAQLAVAVLKVLAHSDRDLLFPVADTVAIAALSHVSLEVRECGVRAFEYWESPKAIGVLEQTKLEPAWLEEYKLEVIRNIREMQ